MVCEGDGCVESWSLVLGYWANEGNSFLVASQSPDIIQPPLGGRLLGSCIRACRVRSTSNIINTVLLHIVILILNVESSKYACLF